MSLYENQTYNALLNTKFLIRLSQHFVEILRKKNVSLWFSRGLLFTYRKFITHAFNEHNGFKVAILEFSF